MLVAFLTSRADLLAITFMCALCLYMGNALMWPIQERLQPTNLFKWMKGNVYPIYMCNMGGVILYGLSFSIMIFVLVLINSSLFTGAVMRLRQKQGSLYTALLVSAF